MTLGTILVSLAILVGVGAYVVWPFRRIDGVGADADVDRLVEAWVKRAQSAAAAAAAVQPAAGAAEPPAESVRMRQPSPPPVRVALDQDAVVDTEDAMNFCPYCGRKVQPDHVFCPKCGRQLTKGETS